LGAPHTPKSVLAYFQNALRFELGDREIAGLARFLEEAAVLDLVPVMPERVVMLRPLGELKTPVPVPPTVPQSPISVTKAEAPKIVPLIRAREAFANREYRKAMKVIADGEERDPAFAERPDTLLLKGRCEYHLTRIREARVSLTKALAFAHTDKLA